MKVRMVGVLAVLLLLGCASLAAAEELKAGDQLTLSHKTTMMRSLRISDDSSSGDRRHDLKPGTVIKVVGTEYSRGKNWYKVETASGKGWIGSLVLDRQAPSRTWLDMVGKPVILRKGHRLCYTVDSLNNYIYTAPQDIKTTVLEVSQYNVSMYEKVSRARVDVPLANSSNRLKGWVRVDELDR